MIMRVVGVVGYIFIAFTVCLLSSKSKRAVDAARTGLERRVVTSPVTLSFFPELHTMVRP